MQDNPLERALAGVLWSDMQPRPAPGEVPLLAHYTSTARAGRVTLTSTPYRAQH